MNLIIPQNIFSAIFAFSLPADLKSNIDVKESSLISRELDRNDNLIGLIPSCDLINHKNFFVSRKTAVSFDGSLSNSYFYFKPEQVKIDKIYLKGDISKNEILLSKILFAERFSSDAEFILDTEPVNFLDRNYIIAGNENLNAAYLDNRISFSDELAELLNAPYVNFVLASKNMELLKEFTSHLEPIDKQVEDNISKILDNISLEGKVAEFITENLSGVYFDMTEIEETSIKELFKLLYYHGFVDDLFDINFV